MSENHPPIPPGSRKVFQTDHVGRVIFRGFYLRDIIQGWERRLVVAAVAAELWEREALRVETNELARKGAYRIADDWRAWGRKKP